MTARATGSKGASPLSGLVPVHRLKEWRRPPGALPSRMRDRGEDASPAGCEVCREDLY